jgi:hypothetical protein
MASIQMRSSIVACMGAPRSGLLNAMRSSQAPQQLLDLKIYVIDIGINEVWKSYGEQLDLATGAGVEFGLSWFTTVRLSEDEEEDDDDDDNKGEEENGDEE